MDRQVLFSVDEETFAHIAEFLDAPLSSAMQVGLRRLFAVRPPWRTVGSLTDSEGSWVLSRLRLPFRTDSWGG